MKKYQIRR